MEECLFCKIGAWRDPANKLYEDEQVLAFYDIHPQAKVHFLVIPKRHIASAAALTEGDAALFGHIFAVISSWPSRPGWKTATGSSPMWGRMPDRLCLTSTSMFWAAKFCPFEPERERKNSLWIIRIPCTLRV